MAPALLKKGWLFHLDRGHFVETLGSFEKFFSAAENFPIGRFLVWAEGVLKNFFRPEKSLLGPFPGYGLSADDAVSRKSRVVHRNYAPAL